MKPQEKLSRALLNVAESIKDVVVRNVVASTADMGLTPEQLRKLMTVLTLSIEQGYHNSSKSFNATVKEVVASLEKE